VIIENSRRYEEDVKSQIISNLNFITERTGFLVSEEIIKDIVIDYKILFTETV